MLSSIKPSALEELRSYLNPPKYSSLVIQAVLLILGKDPSEAANWTLAIEKIDQELVNAVITFDLSTPLEESVWKPAAEAVDGIGSTDVVLKESSAGAMLYQWAMRVTGVFSQTAKLAKRKARQAAIEAEAALSTTANPAAAPT